MTTPTPTPDQYQRIREIFHGAWERPPGERTAFLDGACAGDASVREQVERLLGAGAQENQFMSRSVAEMMGISGADTARMPEQIGRYKVVRVLGEGGMGTAYEARQENPLRAVAIKTIRPGLGSSAMIRRFAHEAQVLGRLRHPGIAQVYEAGVAESRVGPIPFIAMELVTGVTLDQWVATNPSRNERVELMAKVCDAVQHAHGNGVIHRDLKPGNILVESGPGPACPKVLDFGVARLMQAGPDDVPLSMATDPGMLIGTLAYMSTEQVTGGDVAVDARADVYGLGVLLFEVLCGELPRNTEDKSMAEAARIIRDEEPRRAATLDPSLRGDLDTICQKAMERDPARRYQTAAEVATDLRRYLTHEPIIARPATVMYQARKFARRNRGLVTGLAGAVLALALGVAGTVRYAVVAGNERQRALQEQAAARWTSYRLAISSAEDGLLRSPARSLAQLNDAPPELRNWEWRHVRRRLEHTGPVVSGLPDTSSSAAFAKDGTPLAALVRPGGVEVRNIQTGAILGSFPVDGAAAGALSGDGATLAVRSHDSGIVQIFDIASARPILDRTFSGQDPVEMGLSFDGSLLGIVFGKQGLLVLDTRTGHEVLQAPFVVDNTGCSVMDFSRDNRRLLSSATPSTGIWVYEYELTGASAARTVDHAGGAAFSPVGDMIAAGAIEGIRLRDSSTLDVRSTIHGEFRLAVALAFSRDGERLVGSAGRSELDIWNTRTSALELAVTAPELTNAVVMSPKGDSVLVTARNEVRLIPLADPAVHVLRGHSNYVYAVAWSADGSLIASGGWDGTVRLWDAGSGRVRATLPVQPVAPLATIGALAFSAAPERLLVLTHTGDVQEYDLAGLPDTSGTPPKPIVHANGGTKAFWMLARPGSKTVHTGGGERECTSPYGDLVAEVDKGVVSISQRSDGIVRRRISASTGQVYATVFSPDGSRLATVGSEHVIRIWDLHAGELVAELRAHEGVVFSLAYTPDGSRLASGDADGLIYLWDTAHNEKVAELRGHTSYVHTLAFSPDGRTLCSGSGDGTVRLWEGSLPPGLK